MNDRISVFRDGKFEPLAEIKNDYLKGVIAGEDGIFVLTGNTELTLKRFRDDGTEMPGIPMKLKAEYLNGMRGEVQGDKVVLYGEDGKTYTVDKKGNILEAYGAPDADGKRYWDPTVEPGKYATVTIRSETGAPLKDVKLPGPHGGILGNFPQKDGGTIVVVETDPGSSEELAKNPRNTAYKLDKDGNPICQVTFAQEGTHSVDKPIERHPDGRICQSIATGKHYRYKCYKLKCK
jgi:hypothetical protein